MAPEKLDKLLSKFYAEKKKKKKSFMQKLGKRTEMIASQNP